MINSDLHLLEILMPKADLDLIDKFRNQESISKEELALLGDIIITNLRRYCE